MKSSQLIEVISSLSPTELRELAPWVRSKIFSPRPEILDLFDWIEKHLNKNPAALKKETVWTHLFPEKPFDVVKMDHAIAQLLSVVRKWLAYKEWQNEPAEEQLFLLKALRSRNLSQQFEKESEKTERLLNSQSRRDAFYFRQKYRLSHEKQQHYLRNHRGTEMPITEQDDHLGTAALLDLARSLCMAASRTTVLRQAVQLPLQKVMFDAAVSSGFLNESPVLTFYKNLYAIVSSPEEEAAFFAVKAFLSAEHTAFTAEEARFAHIAALNFCIRNANAGKQTYLRESFDICKMGIENKAFFEGKHISPFTYKNTVTAGLIVDEFEWVRQFIEDYKAILPPRERQAVYLFNLAVWHFRSGDYEQAMLLLRDSDFSGDVLTALAARAMLLRIYMEKGYFDALESLLDSFATFVKRHKNLGYQSENYLNLIHFTRQLMRILPGDSVALVQIREKMIDCTALAEKKWLLGFVK